MSGATVSGQVELRDSKEKAVRRDHDYSGVVVWLEAQAAPAAAATARATMIQKNKRFLPHILAIRKGTVVDFPNQDPIFHNAFSNFSGQSFDVGLYKPGSTRAVTFNRDGVVRVFCNIHSTMSAVIVVVDTPWFATTATNGAFRFNGVPPGHYRMNIFHERATSEELSRAALPVTITGADVTLPVVTISETGYLPTPHLNKHNKPYSAGSDSYKVLK